MIKRKFITLLATTTSILITNQVQAQDFPKQYELQNAQGQVVSCNAILGTGTKVVNGVTVPVYSSESTVSNTTLNIYGSQIPNTGECTTGISGNTYLAAYFNSILGIDTHLGYTDSTYNALYNGTGYPSNSADKYVTAAMTYLGIHQIRDGVNSSILPYLQTLAKEGAYFMLGDSGNSPTVLQSNLSLIDAVNQTTNYTGRVGAVEGPNEINNNPQTWAPTGDTGLSGAEEEQSSLASLVYADTSTPHIPYVAYFTGYDGVTGGPGPNPTPKYADFDNQHPYPLYGWPPYYAMYRPTAYPNADNNLSELVVATETGYSAADVDRVTRAKETLDIPFDAAAQNYIKVYLYQLLEGYTTSGNGYGDGLYGFFNYQNTYTANSQDPYNGTLPTPAAIAMHNLLAITEEGGANPTAVQPTRFYRSSATQLATTQLNYTVTGLPYNGYCQNYNNCVPDTVFNPTIALQEADGSYIIAVWAEQKIWDEHTRAELPINPTVPLPNGTTYTRPSYVGVTISLPAELPNGTGFTYQVYDPYVGTSPLAASPTVNKTTNPDQFTFTYTAPSQGVTATINLLLVDHPMLVKLIPTN